MVKPGGNERLVERSILLRRAFSVMDLFRVGKELEIPHFDKFSSGWEMYDVDEASSQIASKIDDDELKRIFRDHKPRRWAIFRGRYYALEDGKLSVEGAWKAIQDGIQRVEFRYGSDVTSVLKALVKSGGLASMEDMKTSTEAAELPKIMDELERMDVIVTSYRGDRYQEWKILEESLPIVEVELGIKKRSRKMFPRERVVPEQKAEVIDHLTEEKQRVEKMDRELDEYLADLLKHRLDRTVKFGKGLSIEALSSYLQELFGPVLCFDSLLSITQQYGLANTEIVHEHGKTGIRTGWSLALFGDPGTGKSFSTRDMILGKPGGKIGAHGIPGRNRYCGGMTPARFIRVGEAYAARVFNFIVPEFNDFFKYKGMVEPLKLAMEQGEIKYELHRETIGPYRFTSFFSVNYNVAVHDRGYAVTIQDPNFNAIEDRTLCRLHRLTKERFVEITRSQMRLALGQINIEKEAQKIRDHLTLIYAIETGHPSVKDRFPYKPVMITPRVYEALGKAREAMLEEIPQKIVKFSARLEDRALRFACSASLMDYFRSDLDHIPVSEEALRYAVQIYVEEASVRSGEAFQPEDVLGKLAKD